MDNDNPDCPKNSILAKLIRGGLNVAAGAIPCAGGVLSATAAAWSEHEQDQVNKFLTYRQLLHEKELSEQLKTIHEIVQRLDKIDLDSSERIQSTKFQSLVEKCFRNWSNINSEKKREYVRNILVNAATTDISSDDVIRLFIDWIGLYSELHFQVISCIYQHQNGINLGQIWQRIGKEIVREDSAEADLYKLLIRDLSTGGIIRQFRRTDYSGNFIKESSSKSSKNLARKMKSAFAESEKYVLTGLGQQFVHYAMSDIITKIEYQQEASGD